MFTSLILDTSPVATYDYRRGLRKKRRRRGLLRRRRRRGPLRKKRRRGLLRRVYG
jgi:hypothetical protein